MPDETTQNAATVREFTVTEHDDGTISVYPSLGPRADA